MNSAGTEDTPAPTTRGSSRSPKAKVRTYLLTAAALWLIVSLGLIAIFSDPGSDAAVAEDPTADVTATTVMHDHSSHGELLEVPPDLPIPSVELSLSEDADGLWSADVELGNFEIAPDKVDQAHTDGEGHIHLYVDGEKVGRMLDTHYHIGELSEGSHVIRVDLTSNDHRTLSHNGHPISDSVTIGGGPREGTVHIHEDGTSHTHGAGAPKEWVVIYNSDGEFVPERLEIITGDTVTWKNESDYGVWPASNIHPSHEIYPEFDPLKDIEPGESWSFTFTRNGTWRYHNHSLASETGVVISSGGPEKALEPLSLDVDIPQFPDPPEGFDPATLIHDADLTAEFVSLYGPDAALNALRQAANITKINCHDMAHVVGRTAYELYGAAAFVMTPHMCNSGGIHGVIESLFSERGTTHLEDDLNVICYGMDRDQRISRCVHGVGHGIMAWSGYALHESLDMCGIFDQRFRGECEYGVFMENVLSSTTGMLGHPSPFVPTDDPHFPCNEVLHKYVEACYVWQPWNWSIHMGMDNDELYEFCKGLLGHARRSCVGNWSVNSTVERGYGSDGAAMHAVCEDDRLTDGDRATCVWDIVRTRFRDIEEAIMVGRFCSGVDESEMLSDMDLGDLCWDTILYEWAPWILEDRNATDAFCGSIADDDRRWLCTHILLGTP